MSKDYDNLNQYRFYNAFQYISLIIIMQVPQLNYREFQNIQMSNTAKYQSINNQQSSVNSPSIISSNSRSDGIKQFLDKSVPILKVVKKHQSFDLVPSVDKKTGKPKEDYIENVVAFGSLCGVNESGSIVRAEGIFQANFVGALQYEHDKSNRKIVYFQGKIKNIQKKVAILRQIFQNTEPQESKAENSTSIKLNPVYDRQFFVDKNQKGLEEICFQNLSSFKGAFKGTFHKVQDIRSLNLIDLIKEEVSDSDRLLQRLIKDKEIDLQRILATKNEVNSGKQKQGIKQESGDYYVPALVTFQLGKITQINLEKSSADISGTLSIDIRLNKDIVGLLEADQKQYQKKNYNQLTKEEQLIQKPEKIKKPFELTIDFHRDKLMNLPFYNVDEDENQQQDIEDEWADIWDGIDLNSEWDEQKMIMSYKITTLYTAEIDNNYGIFYSPFNLNIIKIVIDLHAIKLGKNKININCCDLTDSSNKQIYKPYTFFSDLQVNSQAKQVQMRHRKHFDRRTKINIDNFVDQGQFKIADNRMTLFPYYKRVFANSATLTSNYSWSLGLARRSSLLSPPQLKTIKTNYEEAMADPNKKYENFQFPIWEFVHLQIPIFKYAIIDMIRIFVPILILSTISLLIFVQENAKDGNGFTTLAKRIASGCSLMIAYVALVPMIRSNLPPTPSVTLVQILIYISTIPNFLAIISNIFIDFIDFQDFFDNYRIFSDGLFIASFIISVLSFILLFLLVFIFAQKNYQSDFFVRNKHPSTVDEMRSPWFLQFISKVQKDRKEYLPIPFQLPKIKQN